MNVNFVVNTFRQDAVEAARSTGRWLSERSVTVSADAHSAGVLHLPAVEDEAIPEADVVISFGGDGTLIRAAHLCSLKATPILGVYYGRFGFVTQCRPGEVGAVLSEFIDGKAVLEDRMMIRTELVRQGDVVESLHCLNEATVQRATTTRMLIFEVSVDGVKLTSYPADGVLVSTPTGSTAYNLSAGGPILDPRMSGMILTAITPHTLSARPLVLRPESVIELRVETRGDAVLNCDGQSRIDLESGDCIRIVKSSRVTRLIRVDHKDFLEKLSDRLLWSQWISPEED